MRMDGAEYSPSMDTIKTEKEHDKFFHLKPKSGKQISMDQQKNNNKKCQEN